MVSISLLATVVPDNLESANHLAHGEETEELGDEDAAGSDLCPGEVAHLLGVEGLGELGEEGAGGLELLPEVLEVCLEGRDGAISNITC